MQWTIKLLLYSSSNYGLMFQSNIQCPMFSLASILDLDKPGLIKPSHAIGLFLSYRYYISMFSEGIEKGQWHEMD